VRRGRKDRQRCDAGEEGGEPGREEAGDVEVPDRGPPSLRGAAREGQPLPPGHRRTEPQAAHLRALAPPSPRLPGD
jgi:hypothetical protein